MQDIKFLSRATYERLIKNREKIAGGYESENPEDIIADSLRIMANDYLVFSETNNIVYTVWVSGEDSFHVFSTPEKARSFADEQEMACVISEYMIDNPERYYQMQH